MKTITQYTIEEIQALQPSDVKGIAYNPSKQNYSAYLKVCRRFEHELATLHIEAQNQVPFKKPQSLDEKTFQKAIESHGEELERYKARKLDLYVERVKEIAHLERIMDKNGEEYEKYPVRGIEMVLNYMEGKELPELEEIDPENPSDVMTEAKAVIERTDALKESLDTEEKKEINKILTPLKTTVTEGIVDIVEKKLAELQAYLDKE